MNLIVGSNSGQGTVLQAGGAGDHLIGGTQGGDYFLAGAGNETLTGGNAAGTQAIFGGTNGTGSGAARQRERDHQHLDRGDVDHRCGHLCDLRGDERRRADAQCVGRHAGCVNGFRVGTDHVNLSGGGWSDTQQNGSTILHNSVTGTTYDLHGVVAGIGAFS